MSHLPGQRSSAFSGRVNFSSPEVRAVPNEKNMGVFEGKALYFRGGWLSIQWVVVFHENVIL